MEREVEQGGGAGSRAGWRGREVKQGGEVVV